MKIAISDGKYGSAYDFTLAEDKHKPLLDPKELLRLWAENYGFELCEVCNTVGLRMDFQRAPCGGTFCKWCRKKSQERKVKNAHQSKVRKAKAARSRFRGD